MIAFMTADWKLDMSSHGITFVEESSLFYNFFISDYSLPFSMTLDDETAIKLGFLAQDNSSAYQTRYTGILQRDLDFVPATLEITGVHGNRISGSFVYGNDNLPLLETRLRDLPFPVIHTDDIKVHAKNTLDKGYPEVGYNFPMVIDPEFKNNTNYERFTGVVNYLNTVNYVSNRIIIENGEEVVDNKNVLTPLPYIMEVLRVGFRAANLDFGGDFFSDIHNQKLLWDTGVFIEQFKSPIPSFYHFSTPQEIITVDGLQEAYFMLSTEIEVIDSFVLRLFLNLPKTLEVLFFEVRFKNNLIFSSVLNRVDKIRTINVREEIDMGSLNIELKVKALDSQTTIEDISTNNFFNLWPDDSTLNIYPNTFTIADVMPDMTFATFLNTLKNWLNLDIKFDNGMVVMDYVEQEFLERTFIDESHLEAKKYQKEFNTDKGYRLKAFGADLYVAKNGLVDSLAALPKNNITTIDLGVHVMRIHKRYSIFTARRLAADFQVLLYDGLQSGHPVAIADIDDVGFHPLDIYERLWKNWLRFRTNSETIKDKFTCDIFENLTTNQGKYKYNRKMLVKKITKRRKKDGLWEVSTESETL